MSNDIYPKIVKWRMLFAHPIMNIGFTMLFLVGLIDAAKQICQQGHMGSMYSVLFLMMCTISTITGCIEAHLFYKMQKLQSHEAKKS